MAIGLPQSAKPADDLIDGIRFEFWEGLDWQRKGGSFHNSLTRWWIRPVYCQIILHPVVENPSAHQQEPCLGLFKRENPLKPKGSTHFPFWTCFNMVTKFGHCSSARSGFWCIFEGDAETGVTCHRMVEEKRHYKRWTFGSRSSRHHGFNFQTQAWGLPVSQHW